MNLEYQKIVLGTVLALGLSSCGAEGSEPTEPQMKAAMDDGMNHPPGETVGDPVKIVFFKKEACGAHTHQGFRCTFDVKVASPNLGASMYNNIPFGVFYKDKDSGKWVMRPPL